MGASMNANPRPQAPAGRLIDAAPHGVVVATGVATRAARKIAKTLHDARLGLGAAVGAGVAIVALAAWFIQTRNPANYFFPMWSHGVVLRYAIMEAGKLVLAYATIGSVVGLWVALSGPARRIDAVPSTTSRFMVALVAGWATLAGLSALAAPAAFRVVPVLRDRPIWLLVLSALVVGLVAARWATLVLTRFCLGAALWSVAMFLPPPKVRLSRPTSASQPDVFLLGVDALGRAGLDSAVSLAEQRAPESVQGGVYYRNVFSQTPLTRVTWLGVLSGRDPTHLGETQMVSSRRVGDVEHAFPDALPLELRNHGYRTLFLSDNAGTSFFDGLWFDDVATEARGWEFSLSSTLRQGLPIPDLLVGRWFGVGMATAFGASTPWRLWGRAFSKTALGKRQPLFVAAHTNVLHYPVNLGPLELGLGRTLLVRPVGFNSVFTEADAERRARFGGASLPSHETLYAARWMTTVRQVADLIVELWRSGQRSNSIVVVFPDHGETFAPLLGGRDVTSGRHGMALDPSSTAVSMLVLEPLRTETPLRVDSVGLTSLYDVPSIVRHAIRGVSEGGAVAPRQRLDLRGSASVALPSSASGERALGFDYGRLTRALSFYPGGDYTVPLGLVAAMDSASEHGWTDGHETVVVAPLEAPDVVRVMRFSARGASPLVVEKPIESCNAQATARLPRGCGVGSRGTRFGDSDGGAKGGH